MAKHSATQPLNYLRAMALVDLDAVVENELRAYEFPWTRGIFLDCINTGYECRVLCRADADDPEIGLAEDQILGHGILSCGAGEAHLLNICVRRDRQGLGLGRVLMVHMLERAAIRGAEKVFLEVRPSNVVAGRLYESMGFREVGIRRDYYPAHFGHEDARVLALELCGRFGADPV